MKRFLQIASNDILHESGYELSERLCKKVVSKQKDVSPKSDPSLQTRDFIESSDIQVPVRHQERGYFRRKGNQQSHERRNRSLTNVL